MQSRHLLVLLAGASLLAACSGGGGGDPAPMAAQEQNVPPASASASTQGLLSYIGSVTAGASDIASPVDLSAFVVPTDGADAAMPLPTANDAAPGG